MSEHAEVCHSGNNTKTTYANEHQPDHLYDQLVSSFPWVRRSHYFSISEPTYHEILDELVITCCIPLTEAIALLGEQTALGARKFCMSSSTSFLRSYEVFDQARPSWAPESANFLFVGSNHEEFRRPFPAVAGRFVDFYFSGDPDDIESHFDLGNVRGAYSTWYGATVLDGSVTRVKQYCYDQDGTAADWQRAFDAHMGRISA